MQNGIFHCSWPPRTDRCSCLQFLERRDVVWTMRVCRVLAAAHAFRFNQILMRRWGSSGFSLIVVAICSWRRFGMESSHPAHHRYLCCCSLESICHRSSSHYLVTFLVGVWCCPCAGRPVLDRAERGHSCTAGLIGGVAVGGIVSCGGCRGSD